MNASDLPILAIEDNHEDYESMVRVFTRIGLKNPLYRIVLGTDCLDYLERRMSHQKRASEPLPGLILLDLHLPAIDGFDVLQQIKSNQNFKHIPVIVMSTSDNPRDIRKCYDLGANGYMVKDADYDKYTESLKTLAHYWLDCISLPEPTYMSH